MIEIISYERVGPIEFGMGVEQVAGLLGPPAEVLTNRRGERDEVRGRLSIRYSKIEAKVVEFALMPGTSVAIRGVDVFSDPSAFPRLIAMDREPFEFVGFIILLKLGITLTGFHDRDESQKAVGAFSKGRWDHLRSQFSAFATSS